MTFPTTPAGGRVHAAALAYEDDAATQPSMLRGLAEALVLQRAKTNALLRHDEVGSGKRRFHDPRRCPAFALPALAARAGVRPGNLSEQQLRDAIQNRPRARRCTRPALIAAVLTALDPFATAQDVRVLERNNDNPYLLVVIVRAARIRTDLAAVRRAALTQKPLFVRLEVFSSDRPFIDEGTATIDDVTATIDAATLADVT